MDELESDLGNLPHLILHPHTIIFSSNCEIRVSIFRQNVKTKTATKIRLKNITSKSTLEKKEANKLTMLFPCRLEHDSCPGGRTRLSDLRNPWKSWLKSQ